MTDFAFQLYSARNFPPLTDTLKMLKAAGYTAVEGYGALYADEAKVAELTDNLAASGLKMPTGHFGLDMIENQPGRVLEIAKALDIETIYCPYLLPDQRPDTGAGYLAFGQRLQEAGKPIRDAGLGFGWHNHAFEFEPLADGVDPAGGDLRGRPRPRMGGRPRLGGQGRRRPARMDQDLRQAPDRRPPQGHRPRRRE